MSAVQSSAIDHTPAEHLRADWLSGRQRRPRHLKAELAAFCELSALLAVEPEGAIPRFLELAMNLCEADAACVSMLQIGASEPTFRWQAVSGSLASYEGQETSRNQSLCGLCLDTGNALLVSQPAQKFPYLNQFHPAIAEVLVVPLYDHTERPLGTVWLARNGAPQFGERDTQILEQLSIQLTLALKLSYAEEKYRQTIALSNSHADDRKGFAQSLLEERISVRRLESAQNELRRQVALKDAAILEMDHRAKNTLQVAANFLALQARTTSSAEARNALQEGHRRLHVLARFHEQLCMSGDPHKRLHMPELLEDLGNALRTAFTEMSTRVTLNLAADRVWVEEQDAIPLALLANELITNAYKHAFPYELRGEIVVTLTTLPYDATMNSIVLRVTDNGVGMEPAARDKGFGQTLVSSFAEHLKGKLVFAEHEGTLGTTSTLTMQRPISHCDTEKR